jgi:hypothetical protein
MNPGLLATLQALDPGVLTDLVRQDRRNPAFKILDWAVQSLSHERIVDTTGGLDRFSGYGRGGVKDIMPWALVLKIVNRPAEGCQGSRQWCDCKRELIADIKGPALTHT